MAIVLGLAALERRRAALAAVVVLVLIVPACSSSHASRDGGDASPGGDMGAVDLGDGGADLGHEMGDAQPDAGDASCVGAPSEMPGRACLGQLVLRGAPVSSDLPFEPLGPIDGAYLFAYAAVSPDVSAVAHISLDPSRHDASRPLDGFPLTVGGRPFVAGAPEIALSPARLLAVSVGDGVESRVALYDSSARLAGPMATLESTDTRFDEGCDEVLTFGTFRKPFSAHQYKDSEGKLSHATLAQRASSAVPTSRALPSALKYRAF